jgi:RNA polymerase sigma-70 factor (ECF subfamily)
VASNLVVDHVRRDRARTAVLSSLDSPSASPSSESEVVHDEDLRTLDRAIANLPEDLRTVLALHAIANLNSREIGELLGRPPGTVRYQLSQARHLLTEALAR